MLFTPTTTYPVLRKIPERELEGLAYNMYLTQWIVRQAFLPFGRDPEDVSQIAKRISRRTFNPLWFVLGMPNAFVASL